MCGSQNFIHDKVLQSTRIFLVSSFIYGSTAFAANNRCVFRAASGAYNELVADTNITTAAMDSFFMVTAIAGDTYPFLGNAWTFDNVNRAIYIMGNGRIYVGIDTGFALFDGLYADTMQLIDGTSKVSYKIEGTGHEKILKVQWKNMKVWSGPANNYINLQVWMYESTGVVEFHYGPRSANNASGYNNPVTGLYIGLWYSDTSFAHVYEKMNLKGTPPAIIVDSALNLTVPNIKGAPDSGTVYRFIPKAALVSVASVKEDAVVHIVPNPSAGEVMITLAPLASATSVKLIDASGRQVAQYTIPSGSSQLRISVEHVAAGNYQLLFQNSETVFHRTITVVH